MPTFDQLFSGLPIDTQKLIKIAWDHLPEGERDNLKSLIKDIPLDKGLMTILMTTVAKEFKTAFGKKSKVAIVGPANVGKSTLYNYFVTTKSDRALVGPLPGTTRINQQGDAGLFAIVDTPGADAIGEVGEIEKKYALDAAAQADIIVILFDAVQGIKRTEQELFNELKALKKPYIVVLNKMDLVKREAKQVVNLAASSLGIQPDQLIPVNAKDGNNVSKIILALASAEPEIVAALGTALPAYRWQLAWSTMISAAAASAAIALLPLPIIDFIPLVIVQSAMVVSISRIYSYQITLERARELVVTFGLGLLGRTLFQELSRLGGIPGWMLGAAIASSTTIAMGYAATVWFSRGEKLTGAALNTIVKHMTGYLVNVLKGQGKKAPDRAMLEASITKALESSPAAQNPALLEAGSPQNSGNQPGQKP